MRRTHDPTKCRDDFLMMMLRAFLMVALIGPVAAPEPARGGEGDTLESRLMPLIQAHKGKVGVAVKNLKTGESFAYHDDVPMPTASLIKFPVMVEAYRQAAEKQADLGKMITLTKADKVPGSGILTTHFSDGVTLPLRDAIHLMIVYSDNTATNLVVDQIGIKSTADTMEKMGYPNTKLHSKVYRRDTSVFPERSKQFGLGSTTAGEMVRLCEALHKKELVSPEASAAMLDHMRACDDKDKFPRFLPPGTRVAFKTGSVDASKTAAGIIETPGGPVALCVMTDENEDKRWVADNAGNKLCAEVAREVYDHFKAKGEPKPSAGPSDKP
ncbi:serine hydrolase [Tundrisphaera sp. TA3]|uniref:serine hydrolase n=1 Tax=Tundrisphaera sp. TA3 TaxID=3435775 RepID=UPI003EB6E57A